MANPFVSLVLICGDEGVQFLSRMLKSVLERSMVDEIVIGWNGSQDVKFTEALVESFGDIGLETDGEIRIHTGRVQLVAFRQTWTDDFAAARNEAHARASGVWHFWLDTDDILVPADDRQVGEELRRAGVPERIIEAPSTGSLKDYLLDQEKVGINVVSLPYHYVVDGNNVPLQRQWKGRIIRWAEGWVWHERIHEDVIPTYGNRQRTAFNAQLLIRHLPGSDIQARLERNAKINQKMIEETTARGEELSYREWYNLGAIAFDDREWERAVECLSKSAEAADRHKAYDDLIVTLSYLVKALIVTGKTKEACSAALEMLRISPNRPDGYVALIGAHYSRKEWGAVAKWYDVLQTINAPTVVSVENVIETTAWPTAWAAEAASNLGFHARAVELAELAVSKAPDDVVVRRTADAVGWLKEQVDAMMAVNTLAQFHLRNGSVNKAEDVLAAAPAWEENRFRALKDEIDATRDMIAPEGITPKLLPEVAAWISANVKTKDQTAVVAYLGSSRGTLRGDCVNSEEFLGRLHTSQISKMEQVGPAIAAVRDYTLYPANEQRTFSFFAPIHNEVWTPEQARTKGIGGSEEAVVYLAEELARRGHEVRVYGPALTDLRVRIVDRVQYRRYSDFRASDQHDVLIGHRTPWLAQDTPRCSSIFSWHHDHKYMAEAWHNQVADKSVSLLVSDWQGKTLAKLVPGVNIRGSVIGNGVPEEQILPLDETKRKPHKVVYASQPIRGLSRLLELWPKVLDAYPDAELHIFYGYHTNRAAAHIPEIKNELDKVDALLAITQNVVDHDRVGHIELMNEMRTAGVWAYPTGYPEVSCIAGLRAAAAGCIPVFTTEGSALGETQPDQGYAVPPVKWEEGGENAFLDFLLRAMDDKAYDREALRMKVLVSHTWGKVADRFLAAVQTETNRLWDEAGAKADAG